MLTNKWKAKYQLSLAKKHIPGWRPKLSSLDAIDSLRMRPFFSKGYPVFTDEKNELGPKSVSGQRKYKMPQKKIEFKSDYDLENMHEMQGRFKFEIWGKFPELGTLFEKEVFKTADDLYLTGWLKCRGAFVKGDLQGDVTALGYMQKWLREGHHSNKAGQVDTFKITEENYGVPDLPARTLRCVKDWRKFYTKRDQHKAAQVKLDVEAMKNRSL
jgi:hypothetical protein